MFINLQQKTTKTHKITMIPTSFEDNLLNAPLEETQIGSSQQHIEMDSQSTHSFSSSSSSNDSNLNTKKRKIEECCEMTTRRTCPFCFDNVSPILIHSHVRLCLGIFEKTTGIPHKCYHDELQLMETKEMEERKTAQARTIEQTIPPLQERQFPFNRTNYFDKSAANQEKETKKQELIKGLCCVSSCDISKRKNVATIGSIFVDTLEVKFCKPSHFASVQIREDIMSNNLQHFRAIDNACKEAIDSAKTKTCIQCQNSCPPLIYIKGRDTLASHFRYCCSIVCAFNNLKNQTVRTWKEYCDKDSANKSAKSANVEEEWQHLTQTE